jgi:hypothetical protein
MGLLALFVLMLLCIGFTVLGWYFFKGKKTGDTTICVACAIAAGALFTVFAFASRDVLCDGTPTTKIDVGTHKVAFVYRAGGNVTIGIEKMGTFAAERDFEYIHVHQLPLDAFDNKDVFLAEQTSVLIKAKSLLVIQNGDFKKLHLVLK